MAKLNLLVCDVCGNRAKDATSYTIKGPHGSVSADLCEDDAAPIEAIIGKIEAKPIKKAKGRIPSATMEEIEEAKRQRAARS